jgi:hypothetical protein
MGAVKFVPRERYKQGTLQAPGKTGEEASLFMLGHWDI